MKLHIHYLYFVFVLGLIVTASCKHEIPKPTPKTPSLLDTVCNPNTVYFKNDVFPILSSSCAIPGCHDAATQQNGVNLTNYNSIISTGDIEKGDPSDSDLYEEIAKGDMPPAGYTQLTAAQKQLIYDWILQGALENECTTSCDTNLFTFSADIKPLIDQHCVGCHSGSNPNKGVLLTNYNEISAVASTGQLYGVITASPGFQQMPPANTLSDCEKTKFVKWYLNGYPND